MDLGISISCWVSPSPMSFLTTTLQLTRRLGHISSGGSSGLLVKCFVLRLRGHIIHHMRGTRKLERHLILHASMMPSFLRFNILLSSLFKLLFKNVFLGKILYFLIDKRMNLRCKIIMWNK
ncbi:hypothetical protein N665_0181s0088 [Sinapis alba]|nr:hypothetical protein N665_0181s0088 [Sinapis alba]